MTEMSSSKEIEGTIRRLQAERELSERQLEAEQGAMSAMALAAELDADKRHEIAEARSRIEACNARIADLDLATAEANRLLGEAQEREAEEVRTEARLDLAAIRKRRVEHATRFDKAIAEAEAAISNYMDDRAAFINAYRKVHGDRGPSNVALATRPKRAVRASLWATAPTLTGVLDLQREQPKDWRPLAEADVALTA